MLLLGGEVEVGGLTGQLWSWVPSTDDWEQREGIGSGRSRPASVWTGTELVILVTPYLVAPSPANSIPVPTDTTVQVESVYQCSHGMFPDACMNVAAAPVGTAEVGRRIKQRVRGWREIPRHTHEPGTLLSETLDDVV